MKKLTTSSEQKTQEILVILMGSLLENMEPKLTEFPEYKKHKHELKHLINLKNVLMNHNFF